VKVAPNIECFFLLDC